MEWVYQIIETTTNTDLREKSELEKPQKGTEIPHINGDYSWGFSVY